MIKSSRAACLAIVLAIGGCASREDILATSDVGYVEDARTIAAATDWSKAETVEVALSEYEFRPAKLTFQRNAPYRLVLRNTGGTTHYFVSRGFFRAIAAKRLVRGAGGIENPRIRSIAVPSGTEKEILLVPVKRGTYALDCSAPFHAVFGMVGRIRVL